VRYNSFGIELVSWPHDRCAVDVNPFAVQPYCVMTVELYMMRHWKHSGKADSVHLRMAALLEHKVSVQALGMAVAAMHAVGIVHAEREDGSQHPWAA
jgi:hypothetical protein